MYALENGRICDSQFWHTLTENVRIRSSGEAARILRQLQSDGVLPEMHNYTWAQLCIAFCFAKTKSAKEWEIKKVGHLKIEGGLEIPGFNTCFNQKDGKGEEKFWLTYISQRMFNENPNNKFSKQELIGYIRLAWHNGAIMLEQRYQKALDAYEGSKVDAKNILFNELAQLASSHPSPASSHNSPAPFTGSLKTDGFNEVKAENASPKNIGTGEKIVAALQRIGKGVKQQKFLGRGVKYDSYLIQFAEFNDWRKLAKPFCSAMGIKPETNAVRAEQYAGLPHAYEIKILRDEDDWDKYGEAEFQAALKRYPSSGQDFALPVCLGLDEAGKAVFQDFAAAPHAIVAGATGMGKSAVVRAMLHSLFALVSPDEVEIAIAYCKMHDDFAMFSHYPNLWRKQIITEPQDAYEALEYFVAEMDRRYQNPSEPRKKIVVMIDELVDLLAVNKEAENLLIRLAIKARAAGIHLLLATQRPDAETLSGQLRDNLTVKIALRVPKSTSSNIILGESGAEDLVDKGDHLVKWNGEKTQFLHGYNV